MKKTCFKDERILKDKLIKCERKSIEKFKKLFLGIHFVICYPNGKASRMDCWNKSEKDKIRRNS